ncbi:MAG: hypothetical protein ABI310_03255, partial [Microbacteriaceae bacterium]
LLGQFVECISSKLGPDAPIHSDSTQAAAAPKAEAPKAESPKPAPAAPPPPAPTPTPPAPTPPTPTHDWTQQSAAEPAELNLLSTVMPVLVRRYAVPGLVALIVGAGICIWLVRRRR